MRDLSYRIEKDTVKLSWTVPQTEKGKPPVTGFVIQRSKQALPLPECPNCPVYYAEVGDVPVRSDGTKPGEPRTVVFAQTIESGYRYIYRLRAYNDDEAFGRNSNTVEFDF